ncbi:MAG: hypothetical protein GFH27_549283n161 [Chloroflexi bacterium AL-W]|nr:hypothetical protein [Chloroflexi bacterium AL-N1]NOK64718.1 hypothetical protein [Chloroflexi bacterium AL-N10]NOK75959.1 hypothetical protein [Chloroflexi bacterium AL-N5]NOK80282.1 hypothetical protein [Chloroflexi bacterium AL-W]NOK86795.1 hypothetical protein [Chloroflexi bacterium AL-N15]
MMKPVLTVSAAIIGIVLIVAAVQGRSSITPPATASEPPEVADQKDLPHLIERIQFTAQDFGFVDEEEVTEITLGRPYQLHYIHDQNMGHFTSDINADQLLTPAERWEFPVLLDGQAKGMDNLALEEGTLQFVGFSGNPLLAQSVVDFQAKHEDAGEINTVKLLRIPSLYITFTFTEYEGHANVTRLSDIQNFHFTDLDVSQTYAFQDIMSQIAQELDGIRQNAPAEE